MGGGDAPEPDPKIGQAAVSNAELAKEYLGWMKDRSAITDQWAQADRTRDLETYRPLQDRFIKTAKTWDSSGRLAAAAREAGADVIGEMDRAGAGANRELAAMGVNPNSGRSVSQLRSRSISRGLAVAGARNMARRSVRDQALALKGQAINLGSGLAINPMTSFSAGTSAGASGFNGAMQGNESMMRGLSQDYQNRLAAWSANQQSAGDMFGAIGMGAGLLFSDETAKTDRRKARGILDAVRKLPVDRWRYEKDAPAGDGGASEHVGTMAQDWKREIGTGDGRSIPAVDAVGVNLGAVKELDQTVQKIDRRLASIERGLPKKKAA